MKILHGDSLNIEDFLSVVREREKVCLSDSACKAIQSSRTIVEEAVKAGIRVYAINTGFGYLSKVSIEADSLDELQENIIRSHCTGIGEPLSEEESRGILLLRTNVLAKGMSGVRLELVQRLVSLLNAQVHPVIPCKGSVGASGDLAPLAHLASVLLGEGEAFYQGERISGKEALQRAGIEPIQLKAKEGLSLINGTQFMTALALFALHQAENLAQLADLICSASIEGIQGTKRAFTSWIHQARPYPGQIISAQNLWHFLEGSEIYASHESCDRVQDPYSFRCAPQVHGACRDMLQFVRNTLSIEINAATDNPLIDLASGELLSGGNFHGQPIAFALDLMGMALAELGSISERRLSKLLDPQFSGLPAFLVEKEGLNSGFMITQVTAAALVSETKLLTHPCSTDSIPTSNEKEDHVSMGPIGAIKLKTILENTIQILAIEALAACQALDFRAPLQPGVGPKILHQLIRSHVPRLDRDRYLHLDIKMAADLIRSGALLNSFQKEMHHDPFPPNQARKSA